MKNSADQGECYQQRPKAEVDNPFQDLQSCSYPAKTEFNNWLPVIIIHSKYFLILEGVSLFHSFFLLTKYNTTLSPGFLGQRFNNLQWAALLTSL